ncbi:MAG TPA: hypothetical protein VFO48_12700 [Vicinamibacterales bacterium]|nr:hypothetical protein [Vicinamibacterales bacterium]
MQQRQLRLGDILDDYCPRERRLANHTIVAMVGDDIRLTRCTTCDTEHPYKGGKAPRLRKKKTSVEAAYDEVLDSVKQEQPQAVLVAHPEPEESDSTPADEDARETQDAPAHGDNGNAPAQAAPEEVRLHRPLIRAQLPRIEREPVARPVPEFTIRQANKNRGRFQNNNARPGRFAKSGGQGGGNSRGTMGGHGGRQGGRPQGHGGPMRPGGGRPPQGHGGPRKRSR